MFRDAQYKGPHQQADHMWVLAGRIERMLTIRAVKIPNRHTRLHRVGNQSVIGQFQRGDMGGFLKRLIHSTLVFLDKTPVITQVSGQFVMYLRRTILDRLFHVHHRRQFGNINFNRFCRIAGLRQCICNDSSNRFTDMTHLAMGQHRMSGLVHRIAMFVRYLPATGHTADFCKILTSENLHHTGHPSRGRGINLCQRTMGHIRAQKMHIGLPPHVDVIGILPISGQKPNVFAPLAAGTNSAILRHVIPP